MAAAGERDRDELEAALGARQDLGPAYEPALVESFLDRLETSVEARVDARLAERAEQGPAERAEAAKRQFVLGIVSLGTGIPITAVAGGTGEVAGVAVAWLGIAAVNVAHAWSARKNQ